MQMRARTHAHTHSHARTHAHTHTQLKYNLELNPDLHLAEKIKLLQQQGKVQHRLKAKSMTSPYYNLGNIV